MSERNTLNHFGSTSLRRHCLRNPQITLEEVNTVPGMTEKSLVPKSANFDNESFISILEKIIKKAIA